jgi:hypothetical protein
MKLMSGLTCAGSLLAMAGCGLGPGNAGWPEVGQQLTVEGVVLALDREPWMVDGDATVLIDSVAHGRLTLLVPARINLCQAGGMDVATSVEPGERLRVTGKVVGRAQLSACSSAQHLVERVR